MKVFLDDEDYQRYLDIMSKYMEKFVFWLHNFTLMPNHPHLLLKSESDISCIMHGINLSYAQHYKKRYSHTGHFWQDRFKSHIIDDENYLFAAARYIERNPVRAKLVKTPAEYKYSSYNFYAHGLDCGIKITPNPLYLESGRNEQERRQRYQLIVGREDTDDSVRVGGKDVPLSLDIINAQFIGSPEFAQELIQAEFKKRIKVKRGRPAKNRKKLIPKLL